MKTRIRVVEYNSGRREYVCECKLAPNIFACQSLLFFIVEYFLYLFDGWHYLVIVDKETPPNNKKAVFNTIEEAKEFIDDYLSGYNASQELIRQSQVKDEFFIKHP